MLNNPSKLGLSKLLRLVWNSLCSLEIEDSPAFYSCAASSSAIISSCLSSRSHQWIGMSVMFTDLFGTWDMVKINGF